MLRCHFIQVVRRVKASVAVNKKEKTGGWLSRELKEKMKETVIRWKYRLTQGVIGLRGKANKEN